MTRKRHHVYPASSGPRQHARAVTLRAIMDRDLRVATAEYLRQWHLRLTAEMLAREPIKINTSFLD